MAQCLSKSGFQFQWGCTHTHHGCHHSTDRLHSPLTVWAQSVHQCVSTVTFMMLCIQFHFKVLTLHPLICLIDLWSAEHSDFHTGSCHWTTAGVTCKYLCTISGHITCTCWVQLNLDWGSSCNPAGVEHAAVWSNKLENGKQTYSGMAQLS